MSTDNPPAVGREALANALFAWLYGDDTDFAGERLDACEDAVDGFIARRILQDADEVRRETRHYSYELGKADGRAELQAAIQALCERWDDESRGWYYDNRHTHENGIQWCGGFEEGWDYASNRLREFMADDGAALCEHDERVRRVDREALAEFIHSMRPARARHELRDFDRGMARAEELLRDAAGEVGDE